MLPISCHSITAHSSNSDRKGQVRYSTGSRHSRLRPACTARKTPTSPSTGSINREKTDVEPRFRKQIVPQIAAVFDSGFFARWNDERDRSNDFECDAMVAGHSHPSAAGPPRAVDVLHGR